MSTATEIDYGTLTRADAIKRIKAGLERRSGVKWSVTGGTGTAYGWLRIDAPPSRRTWHRVADATQYDSNGHPRYVEVNDPSKKYGFAGKEDRDLLAKLLGKETVHIQGEQVPASNDHYREYIDRAEGREPRKIAERYWD